MGNNNYLCTLSTRLLHLTSALKGRSTKNEKTTKAI